MKRIVVGILLVVVVVIILAFLGVSLFLDGAVKRGIETVGARLTQVSVTLKSINLSLLSGSGTLKDLVVGNPAGFKSPSAISVGKASLQVVPGSIFSDKVVIKSIHIQSPEITFETDLKASNLGTILANLRQASGPSQKKPTEENAGKPGKKLQVDDLSLTGGKVRLSVNAPGGGGETVTVDLPEIHLQNLGKGPEGISSAELTQRLLQVVVQDASTAAAKALPQLTKGAFGLTNALPSSAREGAEKIGKGLGELLKPKR